MERLIAMRHLHMALFILIALPFPASAQTETETETETEAEDACLGLGIEGLLQQFIVGEQHLYAANLVEFCRSYRTIVDGQAALRSEVDELRSGMPPEDSILIVDDPNGCPAGWRDMASDDPAKFAGRMALAAIQSSDPNNPYHYRQAGGEATHILTIEEMPPHRHSVSSRFDDRVHDGFGGSGSAVGLSEQFDPRAPTRDGWSRSIHPNFMSEVGGGSAQNNMPPYVALYFCKRSSG